MTEERRADLAYWTAIGFGVLFIVLGGPLGRRLEMVHFNDFSGLWSGPATWLTGVSPWDPRYSDIAVALGTKTPDAPVWDYMPWVMFGLLPFGALPLDGAGWIWMALSMVAAAMALRALLRAYVPGIAVAHASFGLALFVGQPGYQAIVLGQWGLLLMSAVAAVVLALRAGRPAVAAVPTLLFLAKPQVFVFTTFGLAYGAARSALFRRYVGIAAVLGLLVVAASWIAVGDWLSPWLADIFGQRSARSAVLQSALNELIGPAGRALAAVLIIAGAFLASRFTPGSDESLAAWLSLSSAGAIYSWSADQVLLFVPLVITAGVLARSSRGAATRFAVAWAAVLIVASTALYVIAVMRHDETFSCLVPDAAFITIVALLWRQRMHTPATTPVAITA